MVVNNRSDVFGTAIANLDSVPVEYLMKHMPFRELLLNQS
jgi:hypothetical protein